MKVKGGSEVEGGGSYINETTIGVREFNVRM